MKQQAALDLGKGETCQLLRNSFIEEPGDEHFPGRLERGPSWRCDSAARKSWKGRAVKTAETTAQKPWRG